MIYKKNDNLNPQICKVEISPVQDVLSVNFGENPVYCSVNFKPGGLGWNLVYASPGKIHFEEEQQDDPAGPFFIQKLEFLFPGEDESTRSMLDNMENQRYLVSITFNSGIRKLLGDLENPCTLKMSFAVDKAGRIFTFQRRSVDPAYLL